MRSCRPTISPSVAALAFDYSGLSSNVIAAIQRRAAHILKYSKYGKKRLTDVVDIGAALLATESELGERFHQWRRRAVKYSRKPRKTT